VPAEIASAASEANSCMTVGAFRGAVLLARSVIEATARDKGMTGRDVVTKIDATDPGGRLRRAHEIRYLANNAAHRDFADPVPQANC
jgi:uncharacterized protein DUF4145